MSQTTKLRDLCRCWIHSYEEDTPAETVYRPADYSFPPARGRTGFELRADQTATEIGIAPTDGSQTSAGCWRLEEDVSPRVRIETEDGLSRVLEVRSVDKNRLVIKKK